MRVFCVAKFNVLLLLQAIHGFVDLPKQPSTLIATIVLDSEIIAVAVKLTTSNFNMKLLDALVECTRGG